MVRAMMVDRTAADAGEVVTIFRDDTIDHNFRAGWFTISDSSVKKLGIQAARSTVQGLGSAKQGIPFYEPGIGGHGVVATKVPPEVDVLDAGEFARAVEELACASRVDDELRGLGGYVPKPCPRVRTIGWQILVVFSGVDLKGEADLL